MLRWMTGGVAQFREGAVLVLPGVHTLRRYPLHDQVWRARGMERADSLAFDPHKWLYTSQSAGCVLLRDFGALSRSFHSDASYIWLDEAVRHGVDFAMHGPQFSRGFAALKVWISLLAHGRAAYGRRIAHDVALAR